MSDSTDIVRVLNQDNPVLVKRVYQSEDRVYGLDLDDNLMLLAKIVPDNPAKRQKSAPRRVESGTTVSKRAARTPRVKKFNPEPSQQTGTDRAASEA